MSRPSGDTTVSSSPGREPGRALRAGVLWLHPADTPQFFELSDATTIGRAGQCSVTLDAERLSRQHLLIRRNGPVLVAEDLGSRNGSYCDGKAFTKVGLEHGSLLRLGNAVVMVWNAPAESSFVFSELAPGLLGGVTLADRLAGLERIGRSELPVIVQGPTGSGKERLAKAVHLASGRKGALVALNCSAVPEHLAESMLFGHRRGAFTGAERTQTGFLEAADGGTLFLDELAELSPSVQTKLLRVLQEREVTPVGETRAVPINARVVVAVQRSLERAVATGEFRQDLFARLNGHRLELPALAQRREDVPFLFRHFLAEERKGEPIKLNARLIEALCLHDWPGNVRELEIAARRAQALYGDELELFPWHVLPTTESGRADEPAVPSTGRALGDPDFDALVKCLAEHGGTVKRAAVGAGLSRARAYRLIASGGLDLESFRRRRGSNA